MASTMRETSTARSFRPRSGAAGLAALFLPTAVLLFAPARALAAERPDPAGLQDEIDRRLGELERRLEALRPATGSAIEDYLDDRGITGLAWTDDDLNPLDRVLRRATLGAEVRLRYERLDNFYDLDDSVDDDIVDYAETRARLSVGYALAGGGEVEVEVQGLLPVGGLFERSAPGWPSTSPTALGPENMFAEADSLVVRRAEMRLPSVNLLGRLARVPVTVVLGRQEIAFGSGFVMGSLEEERGLSYDAVRVFAESGAGDRVDVFWGRAASGVGEITARAGGCPKVPDTSARYPEVEIAGVRGQKQGMLQDTTVAAYFLAAWLGEVPSISSRYHDLPRTTLNTFGVEASVDLTPNSMLAFEGACQWGARHGAGGGGMEIENAAAGEVSFEWRGRQGGVTAYLAYATGDRPHTDDVYEGFTPLAQDCRGRWDELGLLSSSNCWLWGVRARFGDPRHDGTGAHATLSLTHAFADDPASRVGLFAYDPAPAAGKEIGFFLSASAEGRLFDEKDSRLRVSFTSFLPGDYFGGSADPATFLSFEMRLGF